MLVLPLDELRAEQADEDDGERDDGDLELIRPLFDALFDPFELKSVA